MHTRERGVQKIKGELQDGDPWYLGLERSRIDAKAASGNGQELSVPRLMVHGASI